DFDRILDRCLAIHGEDWLTPPLVAAIRHIRRAGFRGARPVSFGLYRDGKLAAGEFGVIAGNVYTSYSGYRDESNSGTVQLILTAQYLREHGFAFFDLGMPLDYKTLLGAEDLEPGDFVRFFRSGQDRSEQDAVQKPQIQL
ncbi:MAG: GNAT family N-acetyltransferase, partial [Treponema sp.]|nr:GNAT family N-acetyltransferase [Treponema sp.]